MVQDWTTKLMDAISIARVDDETFSNDRPLHLCRASVIPILAVAVIRVARTSVVFHLAPEKPGFVY